MTIADRIKYKREELQLTQTELAAKAGYSDKTAISKFENSGDDVTMKQVKRVATALGVTTSYLMGWEDKEEEEAKSRFIQASIHGDKLNQLAEAYDRADPVTKGIVDKILGLALPDAVFPRSPEDNE